MDLSNPPLQPCQVINLRRELGLMNEVPRAAIVRAGVLIADRRADAAVAERIPHQGHGRAVLKVRPDMTAFEVLTAVELVRWT